MHSWDSTRMKRWIVWGVVVLVAAGVAVLVWFQPQKLFIDDQVSEDAPTLAPAATQADTVEGDFESLGHETTGRAVVHNASDGSRTLRLEGFETSNGPDLRVYLSAGEPYGKDFVDLGGLKGNVGDQNYEIPSDVDLDRLSTAVIWCRRFTVAFGAAQLS